MNNNQFRRLVLDTPDTQHGADPKGGNAPRTNRPTLPPMTPRTVKGGVDVDFVRQVRERNAAFRPTKQFKSVAPKGVKYGAGYTDRAKARVDAEEATDANDKASRIQALEEQMKLGQISEETFVQIRDQITGGDVSATHLVKGLDRKLLERVRRGEDVLGNGAGQGDADATQNVDEELEKLGEKEVEAVTRDKQVKKGSLATQARVAGVKRSRDEIMAELKAQRKAAAEAKAAPALDSRWKKVGEKETNRIEIDHKGREVLIMVDEDGMVKKKVRRIPVGQEEPTQNAALMPEVGKPVLGADAIMPTLQIPIIPDEEEEDDDIFEGAGTSYNPLGDEGDEMDSDTDETSHSIHDNGSSDEEDSRNKNEEPASLAATSETAPNPSNTLPDAAEKPTSARPRNYFKDVSSTQDEEPSRDRLAGVQDLLKKAARMDHAQSEDADEDDDDDEEKARRKRRANMLAQRDRDLDDMDMGFGSSRYDDGEDDGDGPKVRLSEWKGKAGGDEGWADDGKGDGKKKRKPKKRKGDVNNAADIMRVIEGRKNRGGK